MRGVSSLRHLGLSISRTINPNVVRLVGGLDKNTFDWRFEDQRAFLERVVSIGRPGGGFIVMNARGVSDKVTPEQWTRLLELSRELRK